MRYCCAIVLTLMLVACATTQVTPTTWRIDASRIPSDIPQYLHRAYWPIVAGEERGEVLYQLNFASAAITQQAFGLARRALDLAIADITSVFSNEENAKRAMRLWYEEGMKDFKGEPYERAGAFFYRGLLYVLEGEFDNARASFEAGFQQDSVAMDSETIADFASLLFLKAWAASHMGSDRLARQDWEDYQRFVSTAETRPGGRLAIIEVGTSPRKVADGVGHYELLYRRGKGYQPNRLDVAGNAPKPQLLEDFFIQATTRGPRPIDRIIEGKAQFMNRSLAAGTILSDLGDASNRVGFWTGAFGARNVGSGAGYASDALNVASAVSLLLATRANPRVDTRYWEGPADRVYMVRLDKNESMQDTTWQVTYPDGWSFSQPATETVVAISEKLEWYRIPHQFRYRPPIVYR